MSDEKKDAEKKPSRNLKRCLICGTEIMWYSKDGVICHKSACHEKLPKRIKKLLESERKLKGTLKKISGLTTLVRESQELVIALFPLGKEIPKECEKYSEMIRKIQNYRSS